MLLSPSLLCYRFSGPFGTWSAAPQGSSLDNFDLNTEEEVFYG